ncbi:reverse transcriptase domain-containing protein [Trichonephila clavipes]|nr:reverse transcriptase domain-containing protein [Trichonephila clavipes]
MKCFDAILLSFLQDLSQGRSLWSKTTLVVSDCFVSIRLKSCKRQPFTTEKDLRQGDSLACLLFNLVLEKCIRDSGKDRSGTLWNRSLQLLAYADDFDIIGRSEKAVKEVFQALEISATNMGLTINEDKTKFIETLPSSVNNTSFCVNGHSFERLYRLYKEPQVTQVIRSNRLRWLGHIWRSPENNQTRAYTFKNPMGSRTRGRPPTRWIDDVEIET